MPVDHKFLQHNFGQGFETHNAILDTTPYKPEILILGTFNPNTDEDANVADFFYGRNWFWTAFFNILEHNNIHYSKQRKFYSPFSPTLEEIFRFCIKFKLTFADLIGQALHQGNIQFEINGNIALVEGEEYDLINDGDLADLNLNNQINWTTNEIIKFLVNAPSIHSIYLTRKPANPYLLNWQQIVNYDYGRRINFLKIFTPSGQGLRGRPRMNHLIKHWLFNDHLDYDRLDRNWLIQSTNIFL